MTTSSDQHEVRLVARDTGFSQTFQRAGTGARQLGTELRKVEDLGVKTGVAIGGLIAVSSRLGQAHQTETLQLKALSRVYGESAGEIDQFAQKLQDMGIASDDATRIAALGAQSLSKNYGLTVEQIEILLQRSADLSQTTFDQYGNQLGLADVMQRVQGAIRGEAESAEILGVALNDQRLATLAAAEGMTGWNTTMTDAEKAQFRMKVFLEDTNAAAGAAAEQSETMAGKVNALKLNLLDAGSAAGGFLGPIGVATATLGDMALAAPLAGAAVGKLADGMRKTLDITKETRVASAALNLAMGPLGLVAAAGLAAGAIYLLTQHFKDNETAADRDRERIDTLNASLSDQADRLKELNLLEQAKAATEFFTAMTAGAEEAEAALQTFQDEQATFTVANAATNQSNAEVRDGLVTLIDAYGEVGQILSQRTSDVLVYIGALQDGVVTTDEMTQAQQFLAGGFEASKETLDEYSQAWQAAIALASDPALRGDQIIQNITNIDKATKAGILTEEQGIELLKAIVTERGFYNKTLNDSTDTTETNTAAVAEQNRVIAGNAVEVTNSTIALEANSRQQSINFRAWQDSMDAVKEHTEVVAADYIALREHASAMAEMGDTYDQINPSAAQAAMGIAALGTSAADAVLDFQTGEEALQSFLDTMAEAGAPGAGLNQAMSMIVGFTGGLVGDLEKASKWANELFAPLGTDWLPNGQLSAMATLLNAGKIDVEDYNEAWASQETIINATTRATEASQIIQIKQANVIADSADATADYLERLSKMDETQMQIALGYADTNEALKVNETLAMAAASAHGELSGAQTEAWEASVLAAAQADSTYAAMLFDLGVLKGEIGDPTTWEVDPSVSAGGKSAIDNLGTAIYDLIDALALKYDLDIDTNDTGATARAGLKLEMFSIQNGGLDATIGLDADTTGFWTSINGIPYTVANRVIDVAYRQIGYVPFADGGIVGAEAAANGRLSSQRMVTVNERGGETMMLPTGTLINPAHATEARGRGTLADRPGSGATFSGPITIVANDPHTLAVRMRPLRRAQSRN